MRLSGLLTALPEELAPQAWQRSDATRDPVIRGLAYDSRRVSPGDLFVALSGSVSDGHDFVEKAIALGAAAVLLEHDVDPERLGEVPAAIVPDTRRALAPLSACFYGEPSRELELVGVTGTNGKTSTTYLVESILSQADHRVGLLGTVEIRYAGERQPAVNTTPESLDLQRTLRAMRTQNIETVVMEVSSHGLELGRTRGCRFAVGAFTNLSQDHLDFHGTMEAYCASKARLFRDQLVPGGHAVINVDDPAGAAMIEAARESRAEILRVSRDAASDAEIRLLESDARIDGTTARVALGEREVELSLPLVGDFNLENLLVALGIAYALNASDAAIAAGVRACPQVPGRMERIATGKPGEPTVFVDYAHTPDAVDKLLRALRPLSRARLITVFGCGGDRDRAKRPLMAEAVVRSSDRVVATSDNPRTEDPTAILRDVEAGLRALTRVEPEALDATDRGYCVVEDRRAAIALAIGIARPEDTVVLAGKGHEDYQIIGREKLPFDDREEARRALRADEPSAGGGEPSADGAEPSADGAEPSARGREPSARGGAPA